MRKGERTKKEILEQASQVFSVRGYAGASIDDLLRAAWAAGAWLPEKSSPVKSPISRIHDTVVLTMVPP